MGVRYPKECNCDASIRFEVRVPRSVSYNFDGFSSVSGDVDVSGVTGRLRASSVSGDVKVKNVSGSANVNSVSGDVEVEVDRLDGSDDMKFSSVSGDVVVKMPSNLDADVDISSMSGSIKTDFPIEVREERHGHALMLAVGWEAGRAVSICPAYRATSASTAFSLASKIESSPQRTQRFRREIINLCAPSVSSAPLR